MWTRGRIAVLLLSTAIAVAISGCGGSGSSDTEASSKAEASGKAVIQLNPVPGIGLVLANSSGKTLYRSTHDIRQNGLTACNGACAETWQPELTAGVPNAGPGGIEAVKLGTMKRKDGSTQATYDGWPLYTYAREGPRESKGVGVITGAGTWFALRGAVAEPVEER